MTRARPTEPRVQVKWTDDMKADLIRLWPNHTARDIALHLGAGVTRNSVLGKAFRLGLPRKPQYPSPERGRDAKSDQA